VAHRDAPRAGGGGRAYRGAHINVKKMIQAIRIRQIVPIQYCVRIFMGRAPLSHRRNTLRNIGEVGVESSRRGMAGKAL